MTDMRYGETGGMTMLTLIAICAILICGICALGRCEVRTGRIGENGELIFHAEGDAGSSAPQ